MKMIRLGILGMALSFGCAGAEEAAQRKYFPLSVGNEWNYVIRYADATETEATVKVDAKWLNPADLHYYYLLLHYNGAAHWVRRSASERISEIGNHLWYRFRVNMETGWIMDILEDAPGGAIPCTSGAALQKVSSSEVVTVPAGTFKALHVQFTPACYDAGIMEEWFAKDVGLVKREETSLEGAIIWELTSARVGGKVIGGNGADPDRKE